ncbi:MAG TPA: FtsX-like permease family protein [Pirellulaceae bacterium]|jgi:lipoprotein-releasing system permease protein
MYKLLLSWRYLCTRYIALASIISVTLGVGTLIVVNSVMAGFTREMHVRLHGILSDVIIESHSMDGLVDPAWHMAEIRRVVGDDLVGTTAAVHVPAMLTMMFRGQISTRQITLIGVDEATYADVSDFRQYLLHPENRKQLSFRLREDGYGDAEHEKLQGSGWRYRRMRVAYEREFEAQQRLLEEQTTKTAADKRHEAGIPQDPTGVPSDPTATTGGEGAVFDPAKEQFTGMVLGIAIGSVRQRNSEGKVYDHLICQPGDDVQVTYASAGSRPSARTDQFTVVDFYESKMSEYDSGFAFVPLRRLQEIRGMIDPQTGVDAVTTVQLRLKPGTDLNAVRDKLRAHFPIDAYPYRIQTWRDMQGPLLAAVQMETTLLNILLFLIIAVAGFGILATFFMIVVEKTRDIGILKALGAPSRGVMSIFLNYGFSLGLVGSGAGMIGGLLFVFYINDIAKLIEIVTGQEVFDPTVYYFERIPTDVEPIAVAGVVFGAVLIAVLASVLPALRAARLHPVEALRYE